MSSQCDITYPILRQPKQLRIDSIAKCNAKCLSCHRFLTKRKGEMPSELIIQILKDVSRWDTPLEEIVPVNYGELFLRKDWEWLLNTIAQYLPKTMIVLPTNSSFFDTETIRALCQIPTVRIINFSVNAYFKETYEAFMGLKSEVMERLPSTISQIKALRPDIFLLASMVFDPQYQTD